MKSNTMKQVKTSMYVQTIYMFSMGLGILLMPKLLLPLFGFTPPEEIWIRVLGALILGFGYVNFECTRQEVVPYFQASVKGRLLFCAILFTIGLLKLTQPAIFLLAIFEAGLAIWASIALNQLQK